MADQNSQTYADVAQRLLETVTRIQHNAARLRVRERLAYMEAQVTRDLPMENAGAIYSLQSCLRTDVTTASADLKLMDDHIVSEVVEAMLRKALELNASGSDTAEDSERIERVYQNGRSVAGFLDAVQEELDMNYCSSPGEIARLVLACVKMDD